MNQNDGHGMEKLDGQGKVFLVGAGPGDPGLITLRAVELLGRADVVVHDRLVSRLLMRHAPQARWIDVGKCPDHHPVPQEEINAILVAQARLGAMVVRLKGGDPFVFGRGGEEALALAQAGIPFEVVPGVTSAIAAPAYAGIPVTQRDMAGSVTFIAGHRSDADQEIDLQSAGTGSDTVVFLMGVHNLGTIVRGLIERGRSPDTPVALLENATTPVQRIVVGTLGDIQERAAGIRPPAIIVVGDVVRLREQLAWFDAKKERPLLGLRVMNTRPQERGIRDNCTDRLEQLGAEVVEMPAVRVAPPADPAGLDQAIHELAGARRAEPAWDWIVFTSAKAVRFTLDRVLALGYDLRILGGVRLGAVGDATALALADYHLKADFIPSRFSGLSWSAEVGDLQGQRVLLPRSGIAPDELVYDMERRGAKVNAVDAYTIVPCDAQVETLNRLAEGDFDVVTFFSPSAVHGLLGMLERAAEPRGAFQGLEKAAIACVGPTTAAAAEAAGLKPAIVPQKYSAEGLVEALLKWRTLC